MYIGSVISEQRPLRTETPCSLEGPGHVGLRLGAIPRAMLPLGQCSVSVSWRFDALSCAIAVPEAPVHSQVGCFCQDICSCSAKVVRLHWVLAACNFHPLPLSRSMLPRFSATGVSAWSFCSSFHQCIGRPASSTPVVFGHASASSCACARPTAPAYSEVSCRCATFVAWPPTYGANIEGRTPLLLIGDVWDRGQREVSVALGPPPFPSSPRHRVQDWGPLVRDLASIVDAVFTLCHCAPLARCATILLCIVIQHACTCVVLFFFTLQVVLLFTLWRLLLHRLPGRASPLGALVAVPSAEPLLGTSQAVALLGSSRPILPWKPTRRKACSKRPPSFRLGPLARFFPLLGSVHLVWAMPPGLSDFVDTCEDIVQAMPERLHDPAGPSLSTDSATEQQEFSWRQVMAQMQQDSLRDADSTPAENGGDPQTADSGSGAIRGLPAPHAVQGLPFAEFSEVVAFDAYVVAPGYQPELLCLPLQVPCEPRDAEFAVSRHVKQLKLPFADVVIAAKPQPWPDASVFLIQPAWTTHAGLSAVVLDMTRMPVGSTGPIVACFLTRPTNKVEILRETGFYSFPTTRIFVGTCLDPLGDDDLVFLDHGCLVTLSHDDQPPVHPKSMRQRLSSSAPWSDNNTWPPVRKPQALAVLHSSGRFTFGRLCPSEASVDRDIAAFVGVERHRVHFMSPGAGCLERLSYRGSHLKGVVALVEYDDHGNIPPTIFLDLRQVAGSSQFAIVNDPRLTYEALLGLLPVQPPRGWRIAVDGGRRRQGYVKVSPGDTLVIGFVPAEDVVSDPDTSSTSPHNSEDEDGEEEHPEEDASGPTSQTSTRSRSRRRGEGSEKPPASPDSGDPSYEPQDVLAPSHEQEGAQDACAPAYLIAIALAHSMVDHLLSCCLLSFRLMPLCKTSLRAFCAPVMQLRVPTLADTVSLQGHRHAEAPGRDLIPGRDLLDRTPIRPPAPALAIPLPEALEPLRIASRVHLVVLVPGYQPEAIVLTVRLPASVTEVLGQLHTLRPPECRRLFPRLIPVARQPVRHSAFVLAGPNWQAPGLEVLFDVRLTEPFLQAGRAEPLMSREDLLQAVGLMHWLTTDVWVAPFVVPLARQEVARLTPGALIILLPEGSARPSPASFAAMLARPGDWDSTTPLPFRSDPSLWVLRDNGDMGLFMPAGGHRLSRNDLAASLGYRLEGLVTVAPEPPIRDFYSQGLVYTAVAVVSQALSARGNGPDQPCVVFLDLRPILQGLRWILLDTEFLTLQQALATARTTCPAGYQVQVVGAPPNLHRGPGAPAADGFRLALEYVPLDDLHAAPGAQPDSEAPSDSESRHTLHSDTDDNDADSNDADGQPPRGPPPPVPRPGPPTGWGAFRVPSVFLMTATHVAMTIPVEACQNADVSLPPQHLALFHMLLVQVLGTILQVWPLLCAAGALASKLLSEPNGGGEGPQHLFANLRAVTQRLGLA